MIKQLISLCKASVTIQVNYHRDMYQTVEEYINEHFSGSDTSVSNEISNDVYAKMIALDSVVIIQFYPRTPVGSYTVYHYDIDEAMKECLTILNES
jgi:hypothetical protein